MADGFYEWQTLAPQQKVPIRFSLRDGGLFAFAGLMERSELVSNVFNNARLDVDPCLLETPKPPPRDGRRLFDFEEP